MLKNIPFYASLLGRELNEKIKSTNGHVLVYGAVEAHSFGSRGCVASNRLIAEETGMKESTVANIISVLAKAGWVRVTLTANNHRTLIEPLMTISPIIQKDESQLHVGMKPASRGNEAQLHVGMNIEYIENTVKKNSHKKPQKVLDVPLQEKDAKFSRVVDAMELLRQDRLERRKPMTRNAIVLAYRKLHTWYPDNASLQVRCIEETIASGWSGLYRLKDESSGASTERQIGWD